MWKQAAWWLRKAQLMRFSVLCPVKNNRRSGPGFGDAPPEGHHHLCNPIPQIMDERHCIVSGLFRMEMSCSVAEKSSADALFCALPSRKNSKIWTELWR
jgi:hypothetical protein